MKKTLTLLTALIAVRIFSMNMDFAEFLFGEGDYFRCITELKREFYENPSADTVKVSNLIAACYIYMGEYEKASEVLSDLTAFDEDAKFNYLLAEFLRKNYASIDTIKTLPTESGMDIKHLSAIFQSKFSPQESLLLSGEIKTIYRDYLKIKNKNPYLALLMSALIPGTGRFYAERSGDGLFSIVTVLTPAVITAYYYFYTENTPAFYAAAAVFGAFYIGELYGAFNSASIYHKNKTEEYYKKVILDYSDSILKPRCSF